MARCFVTRELPGTALERLRDQHEVEVWSGRLPPPRKALQDAACQSEGLLTLLTDSIDEELLDECRALRAIANFAVGVDNVDLAAATRRGIPVGNTPDVLTESTADLTLALMLAAMRRLADGSAAVLGGEWLTWEPAGGLGRDLHGAAVGIVGPGRIGRAVARRVEGFGARVIEAGRGDPLRPLLEEADVVTLHCPLTEDTRGLIDEAALRAMKPTAYLVNAARGPLVETALLTRALREGWIAGAALDVTDPEPMPAGHPLLSAPNVLVVPHMASATHATREAMADMAVDNLLAALSGGRMPHCANPEVYGDGVPERAEASPANMPRMELGLSGRACIVTGASRGIGQATARMLAAEGASVLEVSRSGDGFNADVTDPSAAELIVEECERRFGSVDVLVNNAGTSAAKPLDELSDDDWQAQWELHVMGPMRLMKAAGARMGEGARIVNVCSSSGKRPSLTNAAYSVTKAAQLSLSRTFADAFAGRGVLVNAVAPGPVGTPLWMEEGGLADQAAAAKGISREEALEAAAAKIPLGRFGEEGEIAAAIVFLCSERASNVTGAAWSVDGGAVPLII